MTQLLRLGHSPTKVYERQVAYAAPLLVAGFEWRPLQDDDKAAVEGLVREHIVDTVWEFDDHSGGVVCVAPSGAIAGAAVVGASEHDGGAVDLWARHLVVRPEYQGRGVGFVTLCVVPQLVETRSRRVIGNCAEGAARFYQRAGYSVSRPGEPLQLGPGGPAVQLGNPAFPCWIVRVLN